MTNCDEQGRTENEGGEMRGGWLQLDLKENVPLAIWPSLMITLPLQAKFKIQFFPLASPQVALRLGKYFILFV